MSLEALAYALAAIPVVHKFLKNQSELAQVARHAVSQNTELMQRQTAILETLAPLVADMNSRLSSLEEGPCLCVECGVELLEEDESEGESVKN